MNKGKIMELLGIHSFQAEKIIELIKGANSHDAIDVVLDYVNDVLSGCGVESITTENYIDGYYQNIAALYVNRGDTYDATILYDTENEKFILTSWGDWVEAKGI